MTPIDRDVTILRERLVGVAGHRVGVASDLGLVGDGAVVGDGVEILGHGGQASIANAADTAPGPAPYGVHSRAYGNDVWDETIADECECWGPA